MTTMLKTSRITLACEHCGVMLYRPDRCNRSTTGNAVAIRTGRVTPVLFMVAAE